jgi:hypothetical protein
MHELEQIDVNIILRLVTQILKNENTIGKDNVETLLEYIGVIMYQESFNADSKDKEFEEF